MADTANNTIRKITTDGMVITLAGMAGNSGNIDGSGSSARFPLALFGVTADNAGNVYVADTANNVIRRRAQWHGKHLAGLARYPGSSDGAGVNARFRNPWGVAVDSAGNKARPTAATILFVRSRPAARSALWPANRAVTAAPTASAAMRGFGTRKAWPWTARGMFMWRTLTTIRFARSRPTAW